MCTTLFLRVSCFCARVHVSKDNVLDAVRASHLQRAHQHTAHARLSNMGIFSKNTGSKGAPFYFAPFRAFSRSFRGILRPFRAAIPG